MTEGAERAQDEVAHRLRAIRHVEFVRLGTKVPVVLPQRVSVQTVLPATIEVVITGPRTPTPVILRTPTRVPTRTLVPLPPLPTPSCVPCISFRTPAIFRVYTTPPPRETHL